MPTRIAVSTQPLGLHHDFDGPALVHSLVTVGDLVETDNSVEDAAGLDLALKHVRQQLLDICADRSGPAANTDIVVEHLLRGGDRLVMRNTDASDGAARPGDAERGVHRMLGADAFEDGIDAEAAGQRAHAFDSLLPALTDDIRCAESLCKRDPVGMAAQDDDLFGAKALGSDDAA